MKKDAQISNDFDYDVLDSEQRSVVKQRTEEIKERLQRSAQDIWEIGQKIFEVRSQLAYGNFDIWLKTEFGWSRRTAYNFIKVYEAFPERATVAQVSIAASALYQLSSPSTPPEIRDEIIQRAKQGEKITKQDIRLASKQDKLAAANNVIKSGEVAKTRQKIVSIIPKSTSVIEPPVKVRPTQKEDLITDDLAGAKIHSKGWYCLENKHFIFYGDTASPQFYNVLPPIPLTIAITSNDWDHDWLIDRSENLLVLKETVYLQKTISTLISLLSEPGEIVLFPWLPDESIIEVAHNLNRVIVAGDSLLNRCKKAIAKSNLTVKAVSQFKGV